MASLKTLTNRLEQQLPTGKSMIPLSSGAHQTFVAEQSKAIERSVLSTLSLRRSQQTGVYPVSPLIALGTDPETSKGLGYRELKKRGVTHVMRLRRQPAQTPLFFKGRFPELSHVELSPEWELQPNDVLRLITSIHAILHSGLNPRLLIHCLYAEDRSPTALWLYLRAIGLPEAIAKKLVRSAQPSSKPGEKPLVKDEKALTQQIQRIGLRLSAVRSDVLDNLFPSVWPE